MGAGEFPAQDGRSPLKEEGEAMLKEILKSVLRVLAGTILILALAATIGIPAGKRGPTALDLQELAPDNVAPADVPQ
jgi:hypothetical protein